MQHLYMARITLDDYPVYVSTVSPSLREGGGAATSSSSSSSSSSASGVGVYDSTNSNSNSNPETANTLDRPGLYLAEHWGLRGCRYAVACGYVAALLHFYAYRLPRLSFADRHLAKLHHDFFPAGGLALPVGLVAGLTYGAWVESARVTPDAVAARKAADAKAATTAQAQFLQRQAAYKERIAAARPWYATPLAAVGLMPDTTAEQLERVRLGEDGARWDRFLRPYSALWVQERSRTVRDSRWYAGELPSYCTVRPYTNSTTSTTIDDNHATAKGKPKRLAPPPPPPPSPPSGPPHFTKDQIDGLVSSVLELQHDGEEVRWARTGGRFSFYGMVTFLIAWNSGNVVYRLGMGAAAGVIAGATISAMRLDDIWTHV